MKNNNGDRFTWEKGDVEIYKSLEDLKRHCRENGEEFIQPQNHRSSKKDKE